jgi:hypothetical protein
VKVRVSVATSLSTGTTTRTLESRRVEDGPANRGFSTALFSLSVASLAIEFSLRPVCDKCKQKSDSSSSFAAGVKSFETDLAIGPEW